MTIRLNGATSGYTEIDAPAAAGSNTLVLPTGNGSDGQLLQTNGSGILSWATLAVGMNVQVFTTAGTSTFTPTAGKTSFLVFVTGGGGGGGYSNGAIASGSGGGGGTGIRLYAAAEMGASASVTVGGAGIGGASAGVSGTAGGSSSLDPAGTGLTLTGAGGGGGQAVASGTGTPGAGGGSTNSLFDINGESGRYLSTVVSGGQSFWCDGRGRGGNGRAGTGAGTSGTAGVAMVLEF